MSDLRIIYPSTKTSRHFLFEIDREKKTAYCSACGWTEIHIPKSRKENPKIFCLKRFEELKSSERENYRARHVLKPRHSLSHIDPDAGTAICSVCGPTGLWKNRNNGSLTYICATKYRARVRKYMRRLRPPITSFPNAHVLSSIDEEKKTAVCSQCGPVAIYMWQGKKQFGCRCSNAPVRRIPEALKIRQRINTELIDKYKLESGCKDCGERADPAGLLLQNKVRGKTVPKITRMLSLNQKELTAVLANCEVVCTDCQ
jgi:hypothetical protein